MLPEDTEYDETREVFYGGIDKKPAVIIRVAGAEDIKQAINVILATAKGERVMRADFGCGIHELVFSAVDTAVQAQYLNQAHRWSWGLLGGQVPYLSGAVQEGIGTIIGKFPDC